MHHVMFLSLLIWNIGVDDIKHLNETSQVLMNAQIVEKKCNRFAVIHPSSNSFSYFFVAVSVHVCCHISLDMKCSCWEVLPHTTWNFVSSRSWTSVNIWTAIWRRPARMIIWIIIRFSFIHLHVTLVAWFKANFLLRTIKFC